MAVELFDRIEFRLDGDFVRIRATSGNDVHEGIAPVRRFRRRLADAAAVVAEWDARAAEVVKLAKPKRKRPKH